MNKFIWPLTAFALFCFISMGASIARADLDGFRGMKWGAPLAEIQSTKILVLTKDNGENDSALYSVQNEELEYGEAKLTGIHCSFVKGKLDSVILLTKGAKDFSALKAEAFAEFGAAPKDSQQEEELYNWIKDATNLVLSYNKDSQDGFLFLKQRNSLDQPKIPEVQPAQNTPVREVDRAPVTQVDRAPVAQPREAATEIFTPEIQRRIAIDLDLTRLCWDGVGREADTACGHMRDNVQKLTELGMCMTPRNPEIPGPDITWSRCQPQAAVEAEAEAEVQTWSDNSDAVCHLIGGMFESAAQLRNEGAPPEAAEMVLTSYQIEWAPEITKERVRETVALVYFNPDFAQAGGRQLHERIYRKCLAEKETKPRPPR
jgi:hypothetical protein